MKFDSYPRAAFVIGLALTALAACDDGRGAVSGATLTGDDTATLATMVLVPASLPASPTNAHADDAGAAALGRVLFFDKRMSADGTIACASCHDPAQGFSDPRPVSLGVSGRAGARRSMPATAVPLQLFLIWDGRADSVWSQPLKAIEGSTEMDFTRVEVTRFLAAQQQLADRLNMASTNIGRIEHGEQNLTVRTLAKLADALELTMAELLVGWVIPD